MLTQAVSTTAPTTPVGLQSARAAAPTASPTSRSPVPHPDPPVGTTSPRGRQETTRSRLPTLQPGAVPGGGSGTLVEVMGAPRGRGGCAASGFVLTVTPDRSTIEHWKVSVPCRRARPVRTGPGPDALWVRLVCGS